MTKHDAERPSRLCLKCARRKLGGKKAKPCGDCVLLNVDHLAQVRANAAKRTPPLRYEMAAELSCSSLVAERSSKPARPTASGRRV